MESTLFHVMAGLSLLFAGLVVFHPSTAAQAFALVGLLFNTAALYALLSGEFIAVVQVMVYAGAIIVLFLFVIMLLDLGAHRAASRGGTALRVAGGLAVAAMGARLWMLLARMGDRLVPPSGIPEGFGGVQAVGRLLLGRYLLPFEAIALLFLAAIIGGVVLNKKRL